MNNSGSGSGSSQPPHKKTPTLPPVHRNTGKWTAEEHRLFVQGYKQHGRKWTKIAQLVQSRTPAQVKDHANSYLLSDGTMRSACRAEQKAAEEAAGEAARKKFEQEKVERKAAMEAARKEVERKRVEQKAAKEAAWKDSERKKAFCHCLFLLATYAIKIITLPSFRAIIKQYSIYRNNDKE